MAGNIEDLNPRRPGEGESEDGTAASSSSSSEIGNYLSWRSLSIEEKIDRFSIIKKIFDGLSQYEAEIMGRMLSYKIVLKEANYPLLAERLRSDHYPAHICTTEWEAIGVTGLKYKATHWFIEIEKNIRGNEREEEKVIVDLDFQSQFTMFVATKTYHKLWTYVPNIFVGTEEKLRRIITIICSFAEEVIPPWTKLDYVHSMWLSPNRKIHQ